MIKYSEARPVYVIGPVGEKLTADTLPEPSIRWTIRRKGEIVAAVKGGLLTLAEMEARYNISLEEYATWARAFDRAGLGGLRVTQAQYYRAMLEKEQANNAHRPSSGVRTAEPPCYK